MLSKDKKKLRQTSVSSENYSSSRSDSIRQGNCATLPMRFLNRRRNSWSVGRRGSQDSTLSSSRNDSSAASNSTGTWRISRSSVSSDTSNSKQNFSRQSSLAEGPRVGSIRDKGRESAVPPLLHQASLQLIKQKERMVGMSKDGSGRVGRGESLNMYILSQWYRQDVRNYVHHIFVPLCSL